MRSHAPTTSAASTVHVLANGARTGRHSFWERAGFIHLAAGYVRTVVERPRLRRIS